MIYLLFGEEGYLKKKALDQLILEHVPPEARAFNLDVFSGESVDVSKLLESLKTLPVFSDKRVVLLRNAHELKKNEQVGLEKGLKDLPKDCFLIIEAAKLDKRFSFWQNLIKKADVREFNPLTEKEAPAWLVKESKTLGLELTWEGAGQLVTLLGTDLNLLILALEKLQLFVGSQKKVTASHIESCFSALSWKNIFELSNAVSKGNKAKALILYRQLALQGESPIALVSLLSRHYRLMTLIQEGGRPPLPPRVFDDYVREAKGMSQKSLRAQREKLFEIDRALKSAPIDSDLLMEKYILSGI